MANTDILSNLEHFGQNISVRGADLWYGDFHAIRDISVDIPARQVTAFIGPSGCGKSTFLKCFNRRRNVGMVFQKPNPFPMSIYDNIAYGPRTFGIRKRALLDGIVEESLRAAAMWDELKDRLDKSALGLSGGQQQRLCIARALAVKPGILLMDEPTSALDPISTGKIEELCTELCKSTTIVIVTHNMQQATRISHKTGFFLLGELVEFGDTDDIFTDPHDERTERYITGRFG